MSSPQEGKPIRFSQRQAAVRQAAIDAGPAILLTGILLVALYGAQWLATSTPGPRADPETDTTGAG